MQTQREQTSEPRPYSGAGNLETTTAQWNGPVVGTELIRGLCIQTSVFTLLAYKPFILGILKPQCSFLPAHQKEVPYGSSQKPT